jgi:hypothetical protein
VGALLKRRLIAETATESQTRAGTALNRIWRNDAEGRAIYLHVTEPGRAAIGVEPESGDSAPMSADEALSPQDVPAETNPAPKTRTARAGTKQAQLIAMLRIPEGATIDEIVAATGWRAHTVRGVMAGALKRKLGLAVISEKIEDTRVYRIDA